MIRSPAARVSATTDETFGRLLKTVRVVAETVGDGVMEILAPALLTSQSRELRAFALVTSLRQDHAARLAAARRAGLI